MYIKCLLRVCKITSELITCIHSNINSSSSSSNGSSIISYYRSIYRLISFVNESSSIVKQSVRKLRQNKIPITKLSDIYWKQNFSTYKDGVTCIQISRIMYRTNSINQSITFNSGTQPIKAKSKKKNKQTQERTCLYLTYFSAFGNYKSRVVAHRQRATSHVFSALYK